MIIRSLEQQFEARKVHELRELQTRLKNTRTSNDASEYFIIEGINCIEAGLVLAALQVLTAGLELRLREHAIANALRIRANRVGSAYEVEREKEDRNLGFIDLVNDFAIYFSLTDTQKTDLRQLYKNIRIPLHHGIAGRYVRARDDSADDWVLNALWRDEQAHLTQTQGSMEEAIDDFGVADLKQVVAALELVSSLP